ncbi:hypothetical protein [Nonomuraea sp. CA-141351]|uniref:hypothetical protein n=1 Tax=Nonomuraea sp. CA-141351 TaxID=3239996 RepID=UPI003D8DD524
MDAIKHAAALKERLVNVALSPQFTRELDEAFERSLRLPIITSAQIMPEGCQYSVHGRELRVSLGFLVGAVARVVHARGS